MGQSVVFAKSTVISLYPSRTDIGDPGSEQLPTTNISGRSTTSWRAMDLRNSRWSATPIWRLPMCRPLIAGIRSIPASRPWKCMRPGAHEAATRENAVAGAGATGRIAGHVSPFPHSSQSCHARPEAPRRCPTTFAPHD